MDDTRLGTLLLENNVLQEADLERCLELQGLTGGCRPLGQILIEQGLIDESTLDELLDLQARRATRLRGSLAVELQGEDRFLLTAVSAGATELIVSEGRPIMVRVAGELRSLTDEPLSAPDVWNFVRNEMGHDVLEEIADRKEVTRSFRRPDLCRGRISAYRHFDGIAVTVRLHPDEVRTVEESQIPGLFLDALAQGKGLLLVSGENGCGLSETLATLLQRAAEGPGRHIVVLDSVFESPMPTGQARVVRRQMGQDPQSYTAALRSAIHEDPDVLFIGDVSDPHAFELALRAAEGGRLVVGALRASTVVGTLRQVLSFYPEHAVPRIRATLSSVLAGVLCRKLVPDTDHVGLLAASEYLHVDGAAREILRQGQLSNLGLLLRMKDNPGFSFDDNLLAMHESGRARFEDVFHRATDKTWFLQSAQGGSK